MRREKYTRLLAGSRDTSGLVLTYPAAESFDDDHPTSTRNIFGLTFRQELFCIKWWSCGNVTLAYQDVYGGSLRNANVNGHRLARQQNVKLWKRRTELQFNLANFEYDPDQFLNGIQQLAQTEIEGVAYYLAMIERWSNAAKQRRRAREPTR